MTTLLFIAGLPALNLVIGTIVFYLVLNSEEMEDFLCSKHVKTVANIFIVSLWPLMICLIIIERYRNRNVI